MTDVDQPAETYELRPVVGACPSCGYDLRGLLTIAGATCPECGTRSPFHRVRFPGLQRARGLEVALAFGLPILALLAIGAAAPLLARLPLGIGYALAYIVGCIVARRIGRRWLPALPWTTLVIIALLAPIVLMLGTWWEQTLMAATAAVVLVADRSVRAFVWRLMGRGPAR